MTRPLPRPRPWRASSSLPSPLLLEPPLPYWTPEHLPGRRQQSHAASESKVPLISHRHGNQQPPPLFPLQAKAGGWAERSASPKP